MYRTVLKSPYKGTASWYVTLLLAAGKAAWARVSVGMGGTSHAVSTIPSLGVTSGLSARPRGTGSGTWRSWRAPILPRRLVERPARYSCLTHSRPKLCSAPGTCRERWGDAIGLLQHPLSLHSSPGVGGRRTKIAFLQQGKKPNLPHPCDLRRLSLQAGGRAQLGHFSAPLSRTGLRRGPDFQAAGQPAAAPNTDAQEGQWDQSWDLVAQPECPSMAGTQALQRAATLTLWGHSF